MKIWLYHTCIPIIHTPKILQSLGFDPNHIGCKIWIGLCLLVVSITINLVLHPLAVSAFVQLLQVCQSFIPYHICPLLFSCYAIMTIPFPIYWQFIRHCSYQTFFPWVKLLWLPGEKNGSLSSQIKSLGFMPSFSLLSICAGRAAEVCIDAL